MKPDEIREKALKVFQFIAYSTIEKTSPIDPIEAALLEVDKQAREEGYLQGSDDCYKALKSKPSTASGKDESHD